VAELTDVLAATVRPSDRERMLERLTVEHPRQRFDEANFHAERRPRHEPRSPTQQVGLDRPWSFDPSDCTGATARRHKSTARKFMGDLLAPVHPDLVTLDDLRAFLAHPPRYFLQRVLELSLPGPPSRDDRATGAPTTGSSGLPAAAPGRNLLIELDGIEAWRIRQDLLEHRRAGGNIDSFRRVMAASDKLPPEPLAEAVITGASESVEPVMSVLHELCDPSATPEHIPIDLRLSGGVRLIGSVRNDRGVTPGPLRLEMSSLKSKHLLSSWLDALALGAAHPDQQWAAVHVAGGKPADPRPDVRTFGTTEASLAPHDDPLGPSDALEVMVDLFLRGHREPLPLFPALSHTLYAKPGAAARAWTSHGGGGDSRDEWVQVAFDDAGFEAITSLAVRDDDPDAPGVDRATRYANHLWGTVERSSPGTELKL
jgi:exodeoxyribonuclease V gamma subunit